MDELQMKLCFDHVENNGVKLNEKASGICHEYFNKKQRCLECPLSEPCNKRYPTTHKGIEDQIISVNNLADTVI